METTQPVNRRQFLNNTGKLAAGVAVGVTAASAKRVQGANARLRLGFIGPGRMGFQHIRTCLLKTDEVDLVAMCDIYEGWLNRGLEAAKTKYANAKGYDHYKKLLDAKDKEKLDAVVIATPEHSHCRIVLDAIDAGLDVYVEKPMVHYWEEGKQIVEANKKAKRIIQVGTQRRSTDIYQEAAKIVQSGQIGQVTQVRAFWYRNSNDERPQWRYEIPEGASEKNINWKEFLDPAQERPFSLPRYFQWRCYWDYSNGIASDLMVHQLDATLLVTGAKMPRSVVAMGNSYRWGKQLDPERETPDTWNAVLEYPDFHLNYSSCFSNEHYMYGEQIMGTDGSVEFEQDRVLRVFPESENVRSKDFEVPEIEVMSEKGGYREHFANFFECCRTRKQPNCSEVDGFHGAAAAHMCVAAFQQSKRLHWDEEKQTVV